MRSSETSSQDTAYFNNLIQVRTSDAQWPWQMCKRLIQVRGGINHDTV